MKKYFGAAVLISVVALAAGCAATTGPVAAGVDAGTASQVDRESEVTQEEYEAAYGTFEKCMDASDATIFAVTTTGSVHYYSYLSDRQSEYEKCYAPFEAVDVQWQLANEYDNPTQVALRGCLEAVGVMPKETVAGVWEQIQSNKIDPVACTTR
jgi:hypothetical protein